MYLTVCASACSYTCICVSCGLTCICVDVLCSAELEGGVAGSVSFSWIGSFVAQCLWESGTHAHPGIPYSRFACSSHAVEKSGSV